MDTIAHLKECILKLKNTKIDKNILLARNFENLVTSYLSAKSISSKEAFENKSLPDQDSYEVRYGVNSPANLDAYNNRKEGFNGWEDFGYSEDKIMNDNIKNLHDINNIQVSGQMYSKEEQLLTKYNIPKYKSKNLKNETVNLSNTENLQTAKETFTQLKTTMLTVSNKKEYEFSLEENTPCNLDAYKSRAERFGDWEDYIDEASIGEKKPPKKEMDIVDEKTKISTKNLIYNSTEEYYPNSHKTFELEYGKYAFINLEAYKHRSDGFQGWEEFEDLGFKVHTDDNVAVEFPIVGKSKITQSTEHSTVNYDVKDNESYANPLLDLPEEIEEMEGISKEKYHNSISDNDIKNIKKQISKTKLKGKTKPPIIYPSKGLKCKYCPFEPSGRQQAKHLRKHARRVHFVCFICEEKFLNRREMDNHIDEKHREDEHFLRCNIDGCSFRTNISSILTQLKKKIHKYSLPASIAVHFRSIHQMIKLQCDQCGNKSKHMGDLKRHQMTHDKLRPKVECNICGVSMLIRYISEHMNRIHSERPSLFCSKCKFSSKSAKYMKAHEEGHTDPSKCKMCHYTCTSELQLKRHVKFKHEGEAVLCSFCNYKTYTHSHLRKHEETHNERTIKCTLCEYVGKSENSLKVHLLRHDDPKYFCEQCQYKTYDSTNFRVHMTVKHGNIICQCEECDYKTKSKRSLRQHIKKHHGK